MTANQRHLSRLKMLRGEIYCLSATMDLHIDNWIRFVNVLIFKQ